MSNSTAQTISNQLGGSKFIAMTGARDFVANENGLQFSFPGNRRMNKCVIHLESDGVYTVQFWKVSKVSGSFGMVCKRTDAQADQLRAIFKQASGLDCTL